MTTKAPLATSERIRRLGYCEDGEWDLDRLDVEFARMRDRLGDDNPNFGDAYFTFEYCRERVESSLSQLRDDYEKLWERAEALRKDFHGLFEQKVTCLSNTNSPEDFEILKGSLARFDMRLECLAGDLLEQMDPFHAGDAVNSMLMACLRFMCVAVAAEWPKSTGRRPVKAKADTKPKIQYVEEAYLADPRGKALAIQITAEQEFGKKNPGQPFLSTEHIQRYLSRKHRFDDPNQLPLGLAPDLVDPAPVPKKNP